MLLQLGACCLAVVAACRLSHDAASNVALFWTRAAGLAAAVFWSGRLASCSNALIS